MSADHQPYGGQILGAYLAQLRRAVSPSRRPRSVPELGSCDLELWTVTSSGQTKPHCFLCYSPIADPTPLREALFLHTFTMLISCVDVPAFPVRSPSCAAAMASRLIRSWDAAQANLTTLPRFSPPSTAETNKVPQQSRCQ